MYLIDIFVFKKYYFGSKLLKCISLKSSLTIIDSKNEVKGLVRYSFENCFLFSKTRRTLLVPFPFWFEKHVVPFSFYCYENYGEYKKQ